MDNSPHELKFKEYKIPNSDVENSIFEQYETFLTKKDSNQSDYSKNILKRFKIAEETKIEITKPLSTSDKNIDIILEHQKEVNLLGVLKL